MAQLARQGRNTYFVLAAFATRHPLDAGVVFVRRTPYTRIDGRASRGAGLMKMELRPCDGSLPLFFFFISLTTFVAVVFYSPWICDDSGEPFISRMYRVFGDEGPPEAVDF